MFMFNKSSPYILMSHKSGFMKKTCTEIEPIFFSYCIMMPSAVSHFRIFTGISISHYDMVHFRSIVSVSR